MPVIGWVPAAVAFPFLRLGGGNESAASFHPSRRPKRPPIKSNVGFARGCCRLFRRWRFCHAIAVLCAICPASTADAFGSKVRPPSLERLTSNIPTTPPLRQKSHVSSWSAPHPSNTENIRSCRLLCASTKCGAYATSSTLTNGSSNKKRRTAACLLASTITSDRAHCAVGVGWAIGEASRIGTVASDMRRSSGMIASRSTELSTLTREDEVYTQSRALKKLGSQRCAKCFSVFVRFTCTTSPWPTLSPGV